MQRALIIGGVVLLARLATLPRAPWDAREPEPFLLFAALSIAVSVIAAFVIALREPVAAVLFSFSAAMLVHGVTATLPYVGIPDELRLPYELNVARFTLHPWGSKIVFLPVMLAFVVGAWRMWNAGVSPAGPQASRLRPRWLEPLAWFTFAWLAVGIAVVDPRDGVHFAIPSLIFVSIVAAEGLKALRVPWIGACAIAALSVFYTFPLLRERITTESPLVRARRQPGVAFSRSDADAWGKLTAVPRELFVEPAPRFLPGVGVYGPERSWRWTERYAELKGTALTLRLPADAKIASNDVLVNGVRVHVKRGKSVSINTGPRVVIEAQRAFPLDPPDTRTVAVQIR
jgi:hypothetical protein